MFTFTEEILLSILLFTALSSFSYEILKRFKIVFKGEGTLPFDNVGARLLRVFNEFFLQKKVLEQRFIPGLMHAFVFWGLEDLTLHYFQIQYAITTVYFWEYHGHYLS